MIVFQLYFFNWLGLIGWGIRVVESPITKCFFIVDFSMLPLIPDHIIGNMRIFLPDHTPSQFMPTQMPSWIYYHLGKKNLFNEIPDRLNRGALGASRKGLNVEKNWMRKIKVSHTGLNYKLIQFSIFQVAFNYHIGDELRDIVLKIVSFCEFLRDLRVNSFLL